MHNIAHHQIIHRYFSFFLLSAGDRTGGRDHGQQFFRRIAAAGFLHKTKRSGNKHHCENDDHRQTVKILRRAAKQGQIRENHVCYGGYHRQAEQDGGKGIDECTG